MTQNYFQKMRFVTFFFQCMSRWSWRSFSPNVILPCINSWRNWYSCLSKCAQIMQHFLFWGFDEILSLFTRCNTRSFVTCEVQGYPKYMSITPELNLSSQYCQRKSMFKRGSTYRTEKTRAEVWIAGIHLS